MVETGLNTFLYHNRSSSITLDMWVPTWDDPSFKVISMREVLPWEQYYPEYVIISVASTIWTKEIT